MFVISKKDLLFFLFTLTVFIISILAAIFSLPNKTPISTVPCEASIVIDAGHGEPDGGAVAADGTMESTINLQIAKKVQSLLENEGINVIMTRSIDFNIADSDKQSSVREMKVSDINNRIKIANDSDALALISIHMNKFSNEKYFGWQTFYASRIRETEKFLLPRFNLLFAIL